MQVSDDVSLGPLTGSTVALPTSLAQWASSEFGIGATPGRGKWINVAPSSKTDPFGGSPKSASVGIP